MIGLANQRPNVPIVHTPTWLARRLDRVIPDLPPACVDLLPRDNNTGRRGRCAGSGCN